MSGTTIPGYPLTLQDDYAGLQRDVNRAGIRLMSKVTSGTLGSSTWQWVTWDINATAYITLYLGRDSGASWKHAYQYGPERISVQKGNWSVLKQFYCLFPGDHRWLNGEHPYVDTAAGGNLQLGPFTFNSSFDSRPSNASLTVTLPELLP